jgi:PAS domain S-box-containing protein
MSAQRTAKQQQVQPGNQPPFVRYGAAFASCALALLLGLQLEPLIGTNVFSLFLLAVMVSAYVGGFGPALVAILLSGGLSAYLFLPPRYSFVPTDLSTLVRLSVFVTAGLLISALTAARNRAQAQAAAQRNQLEATLDAVRESQQRLAFLAEASQRLKESLDYADALRTIAHLATQQLADWAVLDMADNGTLRRVIVATADPAKQALADALMAYPPDLAAARGPGQVFQTGRAEVVERVRPADLPQVATKADHLALLQALRIGSTIVVPLSARGTTIGVLTLSRYDDARPYQAEDVALAEDLARRAAQAIDNARLYAAAQQEIAARRASEQALRDSEQRFRATFEQAAVGIAHVGPDGRWLRVNQRLCGIVGYAREELLALSFQDITHPDDLDLDLAQVRQMLNGTLQTYSMEKRYIRKDGATTWINLTVSLVRDAKGAPAYFISVIESIAARKQAEAERDQLFKLERETRAALERANAELEHRVQERTAELQAAVDDLNAFTYTISHDLRAPLRSLQGFGSALLEDYGDDLPAQAHTYLHYIVGAGEQMDQLIQDLLAYSHLSRANLQQQPVALEAAIEGARAQLAAQLAATGATLTVHAPLPTVCGHYQTLVQVLTNLLSNAIKFVAPGVRPQVVISARRQDDVVTLAIMDNGIGITADGQARIFNVFERLHSAEMFPGTGMGLAIVQKAVERMGGRVGVESQPGEGSRFWIELPAEQV